MSNSLKVKKQRYNAMPHSIRAIWFERDGDRCLVHWQSTQLCDLFDTDMGLASAFTIEDDLSIDPLWQQTLADRTARWRLQYPWRSFEEAVPIVRHAQDNRINITSIEYIKQCKSIPFHKPQQQRDRNNDRRSTLKKPAARSAGKGIDRTKRHKKTSQKASVLRRAGKVVGPKQISGAAGTLKAGNRNSLSDAKESTDSDLSDDDVVVLIGENAAEFESGDDLSFVEEQARRLAASGSKRPDNDEDDSEDFDREDKVVAADMKIDKVINQDPFDDKDDNQWSLSSSSSSSEEEPASKRRKTTKKKKSVQSTIADTVRYQSDDENSDIGLNKGDFLEQMMRRFKESLSNK